MLLVPPDLQMADFDGAVELGAVLLSLSGARATQIERLTDLSSVVNSGDEARGRLG